MGISSSTATRNSRHTSTRNKSMHENERLHRHWQSWYSFAMLLLVANNEKRRNNDTNIQRIPFCATMTENTGIIIIHILGHAGTNSCVDCVLKTPDHTHAKIWRFPKIGDPNIVH